MGTWDFIVIGCGGGPDETNLSAYLLKPCEAAWEDGVVALEAGSGLGALNRILQRTPELFGLRSSTEGNTATHYSAFEIYTFVRCYLLTHAHLDHCSSLVLSAGSLGGLRKRIYAARPVLKDLETIFADRIWPNLGSWNEDDEPHKLLYTVLRGDTKYQKVHTNVSVRTMPLSHGHYETSGVYQSSAFFIRHDSTAREFLFFGDVEPDSMAPKPQTINVWRTAAAKIPTTLSTIFIECSWPLGRSSDLLYGHLSPEHLAAELTTLATEVVRSRQGNQRETRNGSNGSNGSGPARKKKRLNPIPPESLHGALDGVRVYVIHCKDSLDRAYDRPINHVIADQVRALVEESGLGAEILATEQGMKIEI